MRLRLRLS
jgi:hypothetical protein